MTKQQQQPITPSPELFNKLKAEWAALGVRIRGDLGIYLVDNAYRAGADCELEACCEWVADTRNHGFGFTEDGIRFAAELRAARRPKPPSLKEQALEELNLTADSNGAELSRTQVDLIFRALEALPE